MTPPTNATRRQARRRFAALLTLCLALALATDFIARAEPTQETPQPTDTRPQAPTKQQFLIVLEGARPTFIDDITPEEQEIVTRHFALLQEAHRQGKVALVGRCDDTPLGLIILQVASREEAQEILDNDPAVQAGLMLGTLHPFTVYMGSLRPD